jgi:hypothetical protein
MLTRNRLFSSSALAAVVAAVAFARPAVAEPPPSPPSTPRSAPLTPVELSFGGNTIADFPAARPGPGVFVMSGFKFEYTNGDHKIRRIAAGPTPDRGWNGNVRMGMRDHNTDDGWRGTLWGVMVDDPRIEEFVMNETVGGRGDSGPFDCEGQVPNRGDDWKLAVRGFDFEYDNGDDHHFKELKIEYSRAEGLLKARIRDDNHDDPVRCRVAYAWLPADIVLPQGDGIITKPLGAQNGQNAGTYPELADGRGIFLSGFKIGYVGGDEFVRTIQFRLTPEANAYTWLQDNDAREAYTWEAQAQRLR